mmetsp:Transcript_12001/g.28695  ORF Transcript_12001/g.28695 Transcript_12001/m.28695 type:complete len:353 (+) Transcript_12001:120-1178(+)
MNANAPDAFESSLNAARKQAIMAGTPYVITKQFPWKLHEMLDVVEQRGETSVVSWLPGGKAFRVHNPTQFVDQIMKKCFNQTKYKSFQRQLNLWGFERVIRESAEKGSYFHPLFLRGRRDLCQEMARQKVKSEKKSSKQTQELQDQAQMPGAQENNNKVKRRKLSTSTSPAPAAVATVSTDGSTSSSASATSATSSPTLSSTTPASLLHHQVSTLPPQQLLPPQLLGLQNPLHILNALQAANSASLLETRSSSSLAVPSAAPMGAVAPAVASALFASNKTTTSATGAPSMATPVAIASAGLHLQQQQQQNQLRAFESAILLQALGKQEAQRASSVFLAAALLGNLAAPKNSS